MVKHAESIIVLKLINLINWIYLLILIQAIGLMYLMYNSLYHPERYSIITYLFGSFAGLSYYLFLGGKKWK